MDFNPRSSCEERPAEAADIAGTMKFQSTLLMRGATYGYGGDESVEDFNPRSSCEERLASLLPLPHPHPFQSTLLMRGAT